MNLSTYERLLQLLNADQLIFKALHHEPTLTSEDSARVRGEDISIGAKAIVMKVDKGFKIFVISAAQKIDSKKIRKYLSAKKTRFASREELLELTGLVPGSVPPFGRPIFDLDLYADSSIFENERIAFNAGSRTDSIIMKADDYRYLAVPTVFDFAQIS